MNEFISIAEKFGVPVAFSAVLLFMIWRMGNRIVNAHMHFLQAMEKKGERDSEALSELRRDFAVSVEKMDTLAAAITWITRKGDS